MGRECAYDNGHRPLSQALQLRGLAFEERHEPAQGQRASTVGWGWSLLQERRRGDRERFGEPIKRVQGRNPTPPFDPADSVDGNAGPLAELLLGETLLDA
jgi:hypothetical protein